MNKLEKAYSFFKEDGLLFLIKKVKHSLLSNSEIYRRIIYKTLKDRYPAYEFTPTLFTEYSNQTISNKVWLLWLQGIDNAPELVKVCHHNIVKNLPNKDIIILDNDNLSKYVELPDFIYEKYKKGVISAAHFSDIIRTACIVKHGGLWLDSTVLITAPIPGRFFNEDILFLQNDKKQIIKCSSWFIYSKYPNHPIFSIVKLILEKYWLENDKIIHYFMYHLILSGVIDTLFSDEWQRMLRVMNNDSHKLQTMLSRKFNEQDFYNILSSTSIHKLTYKVSEKVKLDKSSVYSYILNLGNNNE